MQANEATTGMSRKYVQIGVVPLLCKTGDDHDSIALLTSKQWISSEFRLCSTQSMQSMTACSGRAFTLAVPCHVAAVWAGQLSEGPPIISFCCCLTMTSTA